MILNLSTSRVTETLARAAGCVVFRTPVGEINVVQRMVDVNALLGGEGNGGVIDPRVGLRARQLRGHGDGSRPDGRHRRAALEPGRRLAALCDGQGTVSAGCSSSRREPDSGDAAALDLGALGPDRRRLARRPRRSPRRPAARVGRPLGPRSRQQHRADRAGDRRGRRAATWRASWPTQVGRFVSSGPEGPP